MPFLTKIQLNFRSEMPIYLQIVKQIENMLLAGELKPGDQLPTVRQLAAELDVNFNTVARSYRLLDESGQISTQQGRGTYILDLPGESVQQRLRQEELQVLTQRFLCEVARLGISPQEAKQEIEVQVRAWQAGKLEKPECDS
jgi:GntR family transcriptional regulator